MVRSIGWQEIHRFSHHPSDAAIFNCMEKKSKILIVDDNPTNIKLLSTQIRSEVGEILTADNGPGCLRIVAEQMPDLILLDVMMPGMNGFDVCRQIKADPACSQIPILFITSLNSPADKHRGFELGAVDYITKPFDTMEVKARVKTHLALKKAQDTLVHQNELLDQKVKERTADLSAANRQLQQEIAERRQANEQLQKSEAKSRAILDAMPDKVMHLDARGRVLSCQGFGENFPLDPDQIIGQSLEEILPFDTADALAAAIAKTLRSEHTEVLEFQYPLHDNLRDYEARLAQIAPSEVLAITRDITDKKLAEEALRRREKALQQENLRLKSSMKERYRFGDIIGKSLAMQEVYDLILEAAGCSASVIIFGESGTGKELAARAIHDMSDRRKQAFIPVNCGAIPENLIESEFFGYTKGAFTGAQADKPGYLSLADGGTLFLDEVGEVGLPLQVKLLRVLEGNGYVPIGSREVECVDARFIFATHRNLSQQVKKGLIRQDFYYRIQIVSIHLPPLRERMEDLPLLVDHFVQKHTRKGQRPTVIPAKVYEALQAYHWPGNVRELQNTIQRYLTVKKLDFMGASLAAAPADGAIDTLDNPPEGTDYQSAMQRLEKKLILQALMQHRWHREKAAESLNIPRRTFFRKLKKLGIVQA